MAIEKITMKTEIMNVNEAKKLKNIFPEISNLESILLDPENNNISYESGAVVAKIGFYELERLSEGYNNLMWIAANSEKYDLMLDGIIKILRGDINAN